MFYNLRNIIIHYVARDRLLSREILEFNNFGWIYFDQKLFFGAFC